MANHPQAKKRNRQRIKRTARNRHIRTTMRTVVKDVRSRLESGDADGAKKSLAIAIQGLDTAASKGVMHRRTAARTISRLTIAVNKAQANS